MRVEVVERCRHRRDQPHFRPVRHSDPQGAVGREAFAGRHVVRADHALGPEQARVAAEDPGPARSQRPACRLRVAVSDAALHVRAGEPDLVVEPQPHPQALGDFTGVGETGPPLLAEPGGVVRRRAEGRTGRGQIDHDEVVHAALDEPAQLPLQPLPGDPRTGPPPQRGRTEVRGRLVEQLLKRGGDHGRTVLPRTSGGRSKSSWGERLRGRRNEQGSKTFYIRGCPLATKKGGDTPRITDPNGQPTPNIWRRFLAASCWNVPISLTVAASPHLTC